MINKAFYKLGHFIYHCRWFLIALWFFLLIACIPFIPNIISPFKTTGFIDDNAPSTKTSQDLDKALGYNSYNKFIVLYNSNEISASSPSFERKIKQSLSHLDQFPIPHKIIYPSYNPKQISKDKHTAYAVVIIKDKQPINDKQLQELVSLIKKPSRMTMKLGGESIFTSNVNQQTEKDLYKADLIASPVSIVTMILVFGSLIAAFLPILLGGGCAFITLILLYFLGQAFTLSIFTLNIALMLGLCLSLDYCLFIISRFRDELKEQPNVIEAIAVTQSTAGRAVFFSGIAVFASLSALLIFPINILFSVGVGGLTAVFFAMVTSIVFLPAMLAILNKKINLFSIRFLNKRKKNSMKSRFWLTNIIVHHPMPFFIVTLLLLILCGYPTLSARFGVSDFHIFPENSKYRQFFTSYAKNFNENELTPIVMVVKTKHSNEILSKHALEELLSLVNRLKRNPLIKEVNSIVSSDPQLTADQYYNLYNMPKKQMPASIKSMLDTTTRTHLTMISIVSKYSINSPRTKELIKKLRHFKHPSDMKLGLTGTPVANMYVFKKIMHLMPHAILWIMIFTYLILLVLMRSLFLPLKAILMNLLSLSACFGALVLVFQDGYFHRLLQFQPQGIVDITLLVIIFCALFGFSMDYEVFLLTRIKEAHMKSNNCAKSIVFGLGKSRRIITSAAMIVICICCSFLVAEVLMVKAFGLGIAVAIFMDAFLIRTILVPATMSLLQSLNWYLPAWLDRLLPSS